MTYVIDAEAGVIHGRRGRALKGSADRNGYVQIIDGRSGFWKLAHRMVWESVHGPIPDGLEINHKNGDKADNRIANLELVTRSENMRHAYRTGLRPSRKGRRTKVTGEMEAEIRRRRTKGERVVDIARDVGISKSHVYNLTGGAA